MAVRGQESLAPATEDNLGREQLGDQPTMPGYLHDSGKRRLAVYESGDWMKIVKK
ncbi:MAG: hypothetical protein ABIE25_04620 [Thermoplasmatota archaeon]|nr:hypothetical protein [Candidatus Thermoplasmatota archaeon]MBU1913568.1 hypothetical protein [Candidatus Thermoplasmatota archaeon]